MANIRMANADPRDINYLRKLIASGQLSDQDLSAGTLSGTENAPLAPQPDVNVDPPVDVARNQLSQLRQAGLARAVPGAGFQDLSSGQGVVQQTNPDGSQGPVIRIDAGPSQPMGSMFSRSTEADVTRPIEIAGYGKGYYSKDGKSAIINGQPVMLGYDRAKTEALQDRQMKLSKFDLDQKHGQAQTEKLAAETNILNQKPVGDKPPSGFQFKADGTGLEPIPGGPADFKQQGVFNADTATLQSSMADLDRLATSANTILKNEKGLEGITGIQGAFPNIPGSAAANAQADLGSLKSQVGFGVLQAMRNASKTGGALGNVSDAEGKRLEAALGSLEKAQDLKQFKERLQGIVDFSTQAKERLSNAYNLKYNPTTQAGGIGARQAAPILGGQSTDVPRSTSGNLNSLDTMGYSRADIEHTAKVRGMTPEQVIEELKKRARK